MGRLGGKARRAGIAEEDAQFLEKVAAGRGQIKRRKVAAQATPLPLESAQDACAEDLLSLPASSNLDIALHGPRAAGKLLLKKLAGGQDRSLGLICVPKTCCVVCCALLGRSGFRMQGCRQSPAAVRPHTTVSRAV